MCIVYVLQYRYCVQSVYFLIYTTIIDPSQIFTLDPYLIRLSTYSGRFWSAPFRRPILFIETISIDDGYIDVKHWYIMFAKHDEYL